MTATSWSAAFWTMFAVAVLEAVALVFALLALDAAGKLIELQSRFAHRAAAGRGAAVLLARRVAALTQEPDDSGAAVRDGQP